MPIKKENNNSFNKMYKVHANWKEPKMHVHLEISCKNVNDVINTLTDKYALNLDTASDLSINEME